MALLSINYPNMVKDTELDIPPHGPYLNGHVYEVAWSEEDLVLGEPLEGKQKPILDPNMAIETDEDQDGE